MSENEIIQEADVEEGRGPTMERLSSHGGFISYRPFHEGDRDQVQDLHTEWFPVSYKDEFYDELVHERMVNTGEKLFTCAAVFYEDDEAAAHQNFANSAQTAANDSLTSNHEIVEDEDYIIACVVGSLLDVTRLDKDTVSLLVSDPFRYKRVFYIMTLGTVAEFQRARVASSLVEKCMRIVEDDEQCGALYLHVITFNVAAIGFYERLGFYRVKEIESKSITLL